MNAKIMNNKSREYMVFNVSLRMNSIEVNAGGQKLRRKKYLSLADCLSVRLSVCLCLKRYGHLSRRLIT